MIRSIHFFRFLILLLISIPAGLLSQGRYSVSGKVVDAETRSPLAFVNIQAGGGRIGGISDIDGKFTISSADPIETLYLTYVGYHSLSFTLPAGNYEDLLISLSRKSIDLEEVVIYPTINPAHRIINNVIANRDRNDPEKMRSFAYVTYERIIFTAELDTLSLPDSLLADSNLIEAKEFLNKQDFAIMESVVERKFMAPDLNYENVIANRVSGFRDPIFVFIISQVQSTSFYKELFHIGDKYYVNPISKGSTEKYIFLLEDTLYTAENDTVFIISFRPRPGTNFDAMDGVLYINTNGWAIQNVIANPTRVEMFSIRIQQKYELIDGRQWFPVQLNTDVIFNFAEVQAGEAPMKILGIGKSYIRDIELNPELVRRQFATLGVDVEPNASDMPDEYWNDYRNDSLSKRDQRTYAFMDSIGQEANFDRIAMSFESVASGKIPVKFIDIDMDKLIRYNPAQGLYLGLGAHTNERLSRLIKVGGYWGYGFKNKSSAYGGDIALLINRRNEIEFRVAYFYDFIESGGVSYSLEQQGFLTGQNWRQLMIRRMNSTESISGALTFRALRDFKFETGLHAYYKRSPDDYRFGISQDDMTITTNRFDFAELRVGFRFAFREQFITTKRKRISLGSKYPVVHFLYTRGFDNFLGGDFKYDRFDLKVEKSFYTKYLGKTTLQLRAGYVDVPLPESNLFNGNASHRDFTIFSPFSFATMRMNEFLSDRYIAFYFTHNFGQLIHRSKRFRPEFAIHTNVGFGQLKYKDGHYNLDYNTMEKGYYESGLLVNNMLDLRFYSIGLGAFYRWGPYGFDEVIRNFSFKFSIVFPLSD